MAIRLEMAQSIGGSLLIGVSRSNLNNLLEYLRRANKHVESQNVTVISTYVYLMIIVLLKN